MSLCCLRVVRNTKVSVPTNQITQTLAHQASAGRSGKHPVALCDGSQDESHLPHPQPVQPEGWRKGAHWGMLDASKI